MQNLLFAGRFVFLVFLTSLGVLGIISSFGLGLILAVGYAVFMVGIPTIKIDREFIREAFNFSVGNYLANIANIAPDYLMPTLVLNMLGKEEAAYFYMAFSIGNLILFVPNAINTSFFVEGSHGLKNMRRTLKKAIAFSYAYLIAAIIGVWSFGGYVLRFFGEEYVGGLPLLRLMAFGGVPCCARELCPNGAEHPKEGEGDSGDKYAKSRIILRAELFTGAEDGNYGSRIGLDWSLFRGYRGFRSDY